MLLFPRQKFFQDLFFRFLNKIVLVIFVPYHKKKSSSFLLYYLSLMFGLLALQGTSSLDC